MSQPTLSLFEAVTSKDYDSIAALYAENARQTVLSFLAVKDRWPPFSYLERPEENCNDFLRRIDSQEMKAASISESAEQSVRVHSLGADEMQYHSMLNDLKAFSTKAMNDGRDEDFVDEEAPGSEILEMDCDEERSVVPLKANAFEPLGSIASFAASSGKYSSICLSASDATASVATTARGVGVRFLATAMLVNSNCETRSNDTIEGVQRLLWDAAAVYSDLRPPSNFVVYSALVGGKHSQQKANVGNSGVGDGGPPLFDGSVANSTPPPLGGISAGPSGGSGTILHLACALDAPLVLALLLAMGADARSTHTAFRRLMIHEAACNGSIQCLTLLLELGRACSHTDDDHYQDTKILAFNHNNHSDTMQPEIPLYAPRRHFACDHVGAGIAAGDLKHHIRPKQAQNWPSGISPAAASVLRPLAKTKPKKDFLQVLRLFRDFAAFVEDGFMSELDAARSILNHVNLTEPSRVSIAHSCTFENVSGALSRGIFRPRGGGCADGHGNTPLHWAAFKNEVECVSLLLEYNADPNARAHPSGWTPLHDAAYSNSKESIGLLVRSGAQVDARANSGATPLCFAAQEDAADAALLLLQRGADLSTRCAGGPHMLNDDGNNNTVLNNYQHQHPNSRFSGYTPLHYCAHYNAYNAARVLLKHSAAKSAMEIADLSERLPIHVAVARGSSDVLRELLHAGARVQTPARRKCTFASAQLQCQVFQLTDGGNAMVVAAGSSARRSRLQEQQQQHLALDTPTRGSSRSSGISSQAVNSSTAVLSPVLRAMIPSQPISSSKPWNCLSQRSIDECRELISHAECSWTPERHLLFTPADRQAVMELLRVGKRLEQKGSGIFLDLWPLVLSFCGRGWFEVDGHEDGNPDEAMPNAAGADHQQMHPEDYLMLPSLTR